jgi:hypothetical protein
MYFVRPWIVYRTVLLISSALIAYGFICIGYSLSTIDRIILVGLKAFFILRAFEVIFHFLL